MAKNLYERRLARSKQVKPPPSVSVLKEVIVKRACSFAREYMQTDGWSRMCERKAILLNMAVEHYEARIKFKPPKPLNPQDKRES